MKGPDIKPKLKRGEDTYTANLQGKKDHFITIERDGDEWVRLDWQGKPRQWFSTLTEFRQWVAKTNVSRWASSGVEPEGYEFILWARKRVGGKKCQGRRRNAPGLGRIESHDENCCHHLLRRPLPEGMTMLDLYEEWVSKQAQ